MFRSAPYLLRVLFSGSMALFGLSLFSVQVNGQEDEPPPPSPPCSTDEAKQFDFWIGSWNLSWEGGSGTNDIVSDLGGCVIRENFHDPESGFTGMSVSMYNPTRNVWQQTWVDNAGSYLDFEGGWQEDGTMQLSREAEVQGKPMQQRMRFYNIEADSLDWDWEVSADGGESWQLRWRIHYVRK